MRKLGPVTLAAYRNRVLNIHPALLPAFGGKGFYGERVHSAVLAAGARESGPTVHLVDAQYDQGPIVAQKRVPVLEGDTAETLAARVLEQEHVLYAETLQRIATGELDLDAAAAD
jgi:phosphoribosylglycinamide formyltransferase 1